MLLIPALRLAAILGSMSTLVASAGAQGRPEDPPYVLARWTVADGLPVNAGSDVLQGGDGYLWAATFDGLVRFDGARLTVLGTGPELPSSRIVRVEEAGDGALWLLDQYGHVSSFDGAGFTRRLDPAPGGQPSLHATDDGAVWVGAAAGPLVYRDGALRPFTPGLVRGRLAGVHVEGRTTWLATRHTAFRFEGGALTARVPAPATVDLCPAPGGGVWLVGADGGMRRWSGGRLSPVAGVPEGASRCFGDGDGRWVVAGEALWWWEDGRAMPAPFAPGVPATAHLRVRRGPGDAWWAADDAGVWRGGRLVAPLPAPPRALALDDAGDVWVITDGGGLVRLKPSPLRTLGAAEGLAHPNTYAVAQATDGAVWVGTTDGVTRLAPDGTARSWRGRTPFTLPIPTLWAEADGTVLVGSDGVYRVGPDGRAVRVPGLQVGRVYAIHRDRGGALWVGTTDELHRLQGGRWTTFTPADGAPDGAVRAVAEGPDGALWFGSAGGLARYRGGRFERLTRAHGLSSETVRALHVDERGVLWVGTEDGGLNRVGGAAEDLRRVWIVPVRAADGLLADGLHTVLPDAAGRLWMSTNRGLFHARRADLDAFAAGRLRRVDVVSYTERDGMRSREGNGGTSAAGLRAADGRLWFSTQDGVVVVDPGAVVERPPPPPVLVEAALADGGAVPITDGATLLPKGRRRLELTYTGLSLGQGENVRFRYRLDGFDRAWQEVGGRRTAYYTGLPPGRYTFRVQAAVGNGAWSREGAALAVVVPPFVWETGWFRVLAVLLLAAALAVAYRQRERGHRRRETELAALVEERTASLAQTLETVERQAKALRSLDTAKSRFFANVSHEFRTPLTLILGPLEELRAGAAPPGALGSVDLALRNARRLLSLVDQLLDLARLEAGRMPLHRIHFDLVALLRDLAEAFAPLGERRGVTFACDLPGGALLVHLDPDAVEKVVTNLLSNAFKFTGPGGEVRLLARAEGGEAVVTVEDTGRGISMSGLAHVFERFYRADDTDGPGAGIGLSLARELAEELGGRISVESALGLGTTFMVVFPLVSGDGADVSAGDRARQSAAAPDLLDGVGAPPPDEDSDDDRPLVLVVDDHAEVRAFVRRHLEGPYRVAEAGGAVDAIAAARRRVPDLVVSDVMMPEVDGVALVRALRADPETDFVPVLLLTARATTEGAVEGIEAGADDYVTKPFEPAELRARVDGLLRQRRHLRERFSAGGDGAGATVDVRLSPTPVAVSSDDEVFLERVRAASEAGMANEGFGVEALAEAVGMSRVHLYRRLRDLTGEAPAALLLRMRLEWAAQFLAAGAGTVSEVAYGAGFRSVSHFSQRFREHHGQTPTAYRAEHGGG